MQNGTHQLYYNGGLMELLQQQKKGVSVAWFIKLPLQMQSFAVGVLNLFRWRCHAENILRVLCVTFIIIITWSLMFLLNLQVTHSPIQVGQFTKNSTCSYRNKSNKKKKRKCCKPMWQSHLRWKGVVANITKNNISEKNIFETLSREKKKTRHFINQS